MVIRKRLTGVCSLPRRDSEGTAHVGRGGAANIVKVPTRTGEEERSVEGKEGSEKGGLREEKGKGKKNEGTPEEGVVERGRRWVAGLVRKGSSS